MNEYYMNNNCTINEYFKIKRCAEAYLSYEKSPGSIYIYIAVIIELIHTSLETIDKDYINNPTLPVRIESKINGICNDNHLRDTICVVIDFEDVFRKHNENLINIPFISDCEECVYYYYLRRTYKLEFEEYYFPTENTYNIQCDEFCPCQTCVNYFNAIRKLEITIARNSLPGSLKKVMKLSSGIEYPDKGKYSKDIADQLENNKSILLHHTTYIHDN